MTRTDVWARQRNLALASAVPRRAIERWRWRREYTHLRPARPVHSPSSSKYRRRPGRVRRVRRLA